MDGRMLLAMLVGLGAPVAASVAILEAASEPPVVHEAVVARVTDAPDAVELTRTQLSALPPVVREAIEHAAREGTATRLRLDAGTEALLLQLAHAPAGTPRLVLAVGEALVGVELHSWTQESAFVEHARAAYRWSGEKADALRERLADA